MFVYRPQTTQRVRVKATQCTSRRGMNAPLRGPAGGKLVLWRRTLCGILVCRIHCDLALAGIPLDYNWSLNTMPSITTNSQLAHYQVRIRREHLSIALCLSRSAEGPEMTTRIFIPMKLEVGPFKCSKDSESPFPWVSTLSACTGWEGTAPLPGQKAQVIKYISCRLVLG